MVAILAVLGGLGYAAYTGAFHTEGSETGAAPAAQEPVRVAAAPGEEPEPMFDLDVDGNGSVNITDVISLLEYLYQNGPPPELGTDCVRLEGCANLCVP